VIVRTGVAVAGRLRGGKKDLIEAYSYLGYYYFLKADRKQAKTFFDKVLALDPNDEKANTAIAELKKQP